MRNSFNFFIFNFYFIFLEISTVVFLTSHLNSGQKVRGMWAESWGVCARQFDPAFSVLSCIDFLIFHSSMNFSVL